MARGKKTGGRQKGSLNKSTAEIKALAQKYSQDAVDELARLATKAESESARVAAIKELLDRGHGKSPQAIVSDDGDGGPFKIEFSWAAPKGS